MSADKKWNPNPSPEDDDDDDTRDETEYMAQKDATLFVIEISESMVAPPGENAMDIDSSSTKRKNKKPKYSNAEAALRCAFAVLEKRIISNPNDQIGILLYGTEQTKHPGGESSMYPNCYLLLDLDVPDAASIKELKFLIENPDELKDILKPSSDPPPFANVLFAANNLFTTKAANFNYRRLFMITDDDNPAMSKDARNTAVTRARDLFDLGVRIEPFFISKPGREFDKALFYTDILYDTGEADNTIGTDAEARYEELLSAITAKQTPRRALFTSKMEIAPGLLIGVKGYLLFKKIEPARSHYIHEKGETLQIIKGTTTRMVEETAQEVAPEQIRKAYKFGGETVTFSEEEMKKIRYFGDPVVRIIGFKPQSELEPWHNTRTAQFLYPSEDEYTGSTRMFAALRNKLIASKLMGIVWFISRRNAAPVLCALWPSEERNEGGIQTCPPGLFLIQLPFADDIRQVPEVPHIVAPNHLIDHMQDIIRQLHMPRGYLPEKYPNPALQKHYKVLQAIALEEELPETFEDRTLPKYKNIHKHAGPLIEAFNEDLETSMQELSLNRTEKIETVGTKRGRGEPAGTSKKIKKEVDDSGPGGLDQEIKAAYDKNTLNKLTVAVLKDWLQSKGMSTSGKKAELVDRVEEHFENK